MLLYYSTPRMSIGGIVTLASYGLVINQLTSAATSSSLSFSSSSTSDTTTTIFSTPSISTMSTTIEAYKPLIEKVQKKMNTRNSDGKDEDVGVEGKEKNDEDDGEEFTTTMRELCDCPVGSCVAVIVHEGVFINSMNTSSSNITITVPTGSPHFDTVAHLLPIVDEINNDNGGGVRGQAMMYKWQKCSNSDDNDNEIDDHHGGRGGGGSVAAAWFMQTGGSGRLKGFVWPPSEEEGGEYQLRYCRAIDGYVWEHADKEVEEAERREREMRSGRTLTEVIVNHELLAKLEERIAAAAPQQRRRRSSSLLPRSSLGEQKQQTTTAEPTIHIYYTDVAEDYVLQKTDFETMRDYLDFQVGQLNFALATSAVDMRLKLFCATNLGNQIKDRYQVNGSSIHFLEGLSRWIARYAPENLDYGADYHYFMTKGQSGSVVGVAGLGGRIAWGSIGFSDWTRKGPLDANVISTVVHELGHNLGLGHNNWTNSEGRGNVMSYDKVSHLNEVYFTNKDRWITWNNGKRVRLGDELGDRFVAGSRWPWNGDDAKLLHDRRFIYADYAPETAECPLCPNHLGVAAWGSGGDCNISRCEQGFVRGLGGRVCNPDRMPSAMNVTCNNECLLSRNGICEDGGEGSERDRCHLGSDCDDCGVRVEACNRAHATAYGEWCAILACEDGWVPNRRQQSCVNATCNNECHRAHDGVCQDRGLQGWRGCSPGSDCADCGVPCDKPHALSYTADCQHVTACEEGYVVDPLLDGCLACHLQRIEHAVAYDNQTCLILECEKGWGPTGDGKRCERNEGTYEQCNNDCPMFANNGNCEDGGEGSYLAEICGPNKSIRCPCALGSDCNDCGVRPIGCKKPHAVSYRGTGVCIIAECDEGFVVSRHGEACILPTFAPTAAPTTMPTAQPTVAPTPEPTPYPPTPPPVLTLK